MCVHLSALQGIGWISQHLFSAQTVCDCDLLVTGIAAPTVTIYSSIYTCTYTCTCTVGELYYCVSLAEYVLYIVVCDWKKW